MIVRRDFSGHRPGMLLTVIIAVAVAGCGGDSPTPTGKVEDSTAKGSAASATASPNVVSKGRRKKIESDEDARGIRERRAQKLKEQAAAKE